MKYTSIGLFFILNLSQIWAQTPTAPPNQDERIYDLIDAVSAERIEKDIRQLVSFGTRNTLSDTVSQTRGIGAARRWIKAEFERISEACDGCLEVIYHRGLVKKGESPRIPEDTWIVNVLAIQRGIQNPNRYIIMSGDIDSRASDVVNATIDAPGANDNATGVAGALEAARVLSQYRFPNTIVYAALSGEEQGLFGGRFLAETAKEEGWEIIGVLNNDMIGNIEGIDGVIENSTFRVFSEPVSMLSTERDAMLRRYYGGEIDGPSRQLARYVARMSDQYMPNLKAKMIYRLDRFGRGGHHRPFNDAGFAGVRIMETHENYYRQHQNIREENGIAYGDVIEGVNFEYCAKLTAVNAIVMAGLGWAPEAPKNVKIGGVVRPSTTLAWDISEDLNLLGYKIYWRETTSPQWEFSRFVGQVGEFTLSNIVIDNYLFGVSSVSKDGHESTISFPSSTMRR